MVDIEPYQYQKTTNVKEHNDIVAKINEIVDVINNSGADTLGPRVSKLETDVSALDSAVKIQYQDIASIRDKDQAQDTNIGTLDAQVKGISESLVSGVNVIDGTTTGKFKVRLDREKAPSINSNDYDLQKATSIELVQGSGPSMLKAQITLSDGTTLISDDFLFTTEAIGTDVYISSFVFKNGNVAGTISADIGLSNGSTLEANNFVVPMDPSLLNTVQNLSTRLTAVEGKTGDLDNLKTQVQTNTTNIGTLTTEIDNLDISKADQSNPAQTIKADTTDLRTVKLRDSTDAVGSYLQFNASADKPVRMEYYNGSEVVDSGFVATVDGSGNPKNFTIPNGGEVWEEVDLNNWPTNWVNGERVKFSISTVTNLNGSASSWNSQIPSSISPIYGKSAVIIELQIPDTVNNFNYPVGVYSINYLIAITSIYNVYNATSWNNKAPFTTKVDFFNGNNVVTQSSWVDSNSLTTRISKMWRLKK